MDESGAMLWGRVTYDMMEGYWPAVARGAEEAPPAMREWAVKLEAKPNYVVSSTRKDFWWTNSHQDRRRPARGAPSGATHQTSMCSLRCERAARGVPSVTGRD
jgi:hypothetical protein